MRIRRTSGNIPLLLFGLLIIALGFGILFKEHSIFASAISADENATSEVENDEHFITIHDNGNASITIRSDAMKVSDAIERAGIEINSGDIVEPGLDENISLSIFIALKTSLFPMALRKRCLELLHRARKKLQKKPVLNFFRLTRLN